MSTDPARLREGSWNYFAVAAPGLEGVLAREVGALAGATAVREVKGGVEFSGGLEVCYRANLWLRTATRVLLRLGEVEARDFSKLRKRSGALPWRLFLAAQPQWHCSASKSRLYHTGAIAETLALAVEDAIGVPAPAAQRSTAVKSAAVSDESAGSDEALCLARAVDDRFTISVDTSGELLHRRGWRHDPGPAPMRETLAAALVLLSDWDAATPLFDPMCGGGTLVIEAAAIARRIAPGLARQFSFERWPVFDAALWARLQDEALRLQRPSPAAIVGSDHDPTAIAAAVRNAERARVRDSVTFAVADLGAAKPPTGVGLVLVNPPYGRRVSHPAALRKLYVELGRVLRLRCSGWQAGIVVPDRRLDAALALGASRESALSNGGLRVRLCRYLIRGAGAETAAPGAAPRG